MVFGDGALGSEFGLDEVYKGIIYDGISAFVGMQTELSLSLPYEPTFWDYVTNMI